jgi:hypothetical protein
VKFKVRRVVEQEVDIAAVRLTLPVRYDDDDMPADFPGRTENVWTGIVDLRDDGAFLRDWPADVDHRASGFYMKVIDGGTYQLLAADGTVVAAIEQDYVPHGVVPGDYGDYVDFQIDPDGRVRNWSKRMDVSRFFPDLSE